MSKGAISILVVLLIASIWSAFLIPFFMQKRNAQAEDPKVRMLEAANDSLAIRNNMLEEKIFADSLFIDSISKNVTKSAIQKIYLTDKKNERFKLLINASPSKQDSFMSTIHIRANGN